MGGDFISFITGQVFDNSAFNELNPDPSTEVVYGQQSWREMFEGWLIYSERTEENTKKFGELFQAGSIQNGDDPNHQVEKQHQKPDRTGAAASPR